MSGASLSLATCTVETFRPEIESHFVLALPDGGRLALQLVEASASPPSPAPSAATPREPFSLLFRGPLQPLLAQATYALKHERLGRVELFLVPVGQDGEGTSYEAVFA